MINKGEFFRAMLRMVVVYTLFVTGLMAQTEKIAFEKYGIAEGLPEEVGFRFVQDRQGFIWIGTQNGLAHKLAFR